MEVIPPGMRRVAVDIRKRKNLLLVEKVLIATAVIGVLVYLVYG